MPKGKFKQAGQKASRVDHAVIDLHFVVAGSLVAGVAGFPLNATGLAAISTRFLAMADAYVYYKYNALRFRMHPANGVGLEAVGFVPFVDTAPTTVTQMMELLNATCLEPSATVCSEWITVPSEDLRGQLPWYKGISGTQDASEEYPAQMNIVGTGTDSYTVEFRCTLALKEGVSTGNTPEEVDLIRRRLAIRKTIAQEQHRKELLLQLKPPPAAAVVERPPSGAGCGMPYLLPDLCPVRTGCPYHGALKIGNP